MKIFIIQYNLSFNLKISVNRNKGELKPTAKAQLNPMEANATRLLIKCFVGKKTSRNRSMAIADRLADDNSSDKNHTNMQNLHKALPKVPPPANHTPLLNADVMENGTFPNTRNKLETAILAINKLLILRIRWLAFLYMIAIIVALPVNDNNIITIKAAILTALAASLSW